MKAKINREIEENEIDIKIEDFCARLDLEILHKGSREFMHISTFNINRPGLQLAGYYEHFSAERVQIIGEMETAYLKTLPLEKRLASVEMLFKYEFPSSFPPYWSRPRRSCSARSSTTAWYSAANCAAR